MRQGRKKAALSAALASYVTRSLSVVIGFVVTPIVLNYLGPTDYGVWAIIGSLLGYYGMLDLGVKGSASTLIARKQRDESRGEISRIASNTLALHLVTGILVLVIGLASAELVILALDLDANSGAPIRITLSLALIALALSFPAQTFKAILRGTQQIARLRLLEFGALLIRTVLVLALLVFGLGLPSLPLAGVLTTLGATWLILRSAKKNVPGLHISTRFVSRGGMAEVFGISLWWFLGSVGALVIYQVDNLVIGSTLGAAAVTPYVLTYRLPLLAREQIYQLNFILMPGVGDLVGRRDLATLRRIFILAFKVTVGAAIVLACFLLLFNRAIVSVWVGPENYAGDTVTALFAVFLFLAVVFHSSSVIVTNFLHIRQMSLVRWAEGIVNLGLSLLLVKRFGIAGVALASVIAAVISSFWYAPWKALRLLNLPRTALKNDLMAPILAMAAAEGLTTAAFWPWRPSGIGILLGQGTAFLIVSLTWAAVFLLPSYQRTLLIRGRFKQMVASGTPELGYENLSQDQDKRNG